MCVLIPPLAVGAVLVMENRDVILLKIHPGFGRHSVRSLLMPPTRGVVLEAFGSGNAPHTIPALCRDLKAATDAGVVVIVVSACNHAWVNLDLYEAGLLHSRKKVTFFLLPAVVHINPSRLCAPL